MKDISCAAATPEERFVKTYVRKSRRDRLLHELTDPKKRYNGLSRFCHSAGELLDPALVIMEGEDLDRRSVFEEFVRKHDGICCTMSPDPFMDGQALPFSEAVNRALLSMDAVIILGCCFAVVFGEVMKGGRGKYLLESKSMQRG